MKYKVGDKVRVRSWESMEKEFGLDEFGYISMKYGFTDDMEKLCGEILTIECVMDSYYYTKGAKWQWTDDMLEPVFDWELFKDKSNKIAVHCKTEEEAKDFCKQMHEHGIKWWTGESCLDDNWWEEYRENTCYEGVGMFGGYEYYESVNHTILEYEDYFTKEQQKLIVIPKKCRRVLKQLNKKYEWIAKDKNGRVYIYTKEPVRELYEWISQGRKERIDELFPKLDYSWLSFEDYAPVNFREVLKGEKQ